MLNAQQMNIEESFNVQGNYLICIYYYTNLILVEWKTTRSQCVCE